MTVGQLKNIISIIPDDAEVEADTGWECGPVPLGKGFLINGKLIFVQEGVESLEQKYENMIEEAKKHLTELMTNFEKWKKKIAEANDVEDFIHQCDLMENEFCKKQCYPTQEDKCDETTCKECKARWLNMEVEK